LREGGLFSQKQANLSIPHPDRVPEEGFTEARALLFFV
jgi:hypothetical protein